MTKNDQFKDSQVGAGCPRAHHPLHRRQPEQEATMISAASGALLNCASMWDKHVRRILRQAESWPHLPGFAKARPRCSHHLLPSQPNCQQSSLQNTRLAALITLKFRWAVPAATCHGAGTSRTQPDSSQPRGENIGDLLLLEKSKHPPNPLLC
jgi:hypothetical protein